MEDKVVDSRVGDEGRVIRRRRECLACTRRYTTFERTEEVPLLIVKRDGSEEPFALAKVIEGIRRACKNRPVAESEMRSIAEDVEEGIRGEAQGTVSTADVGRHVLDRLHTLDEVAYMRFASVYKDFQELTDFERELGHILKKSPPKERNGTGDE